MTNQQHTEVHSGVAGDDSKKRKLLLELEDSVTRDPKMTKEEKKELLAKLNRFNMIELKKTQMKLMKDGQALLADQDKQEKGGDTNV